MVQNVHKIWYKYGSKMSPICYPKQVPSFYNLHPMCPSVMIIITIPPTIISGHDSLGPLKANQDSQKALFRGVAWVEESLPNLPKLWFAFIISERTIWNVLITSIQNKRQLSNVFRKVLLLTNNDVLFHGKHKMASLT